MRIKSILALIAISIAATIITARAADPTPNTSLHVWGVVDKPTDWTTDRIKTDLAADIKTVEYTSRGQKHHADCVALLSLLKAAGMNLSMSPEPATNVDPKAKNVPLRLAIVVGGSDGYTATFSLPELMPDFGNRDAWLAITVDDKPLAATDGPCRLIVPADGKPGRWVRGVASISVVDVAATRPSK